MDKVEKLAQELVEKKICRICLSKSGKLVEYLKDHEWKTILTNCFAISTVMAEKLPKFLCEACGKFLEMCREFKQLCMNSELMMITYPGNGNWVDEVETPRWFRTLQNQLSQQENFVSNIRTRDQSSDVMESQVNYEIASSNSRTEIRHRQNQPTQNSLFPRQPNPQYKPTSAQITSPKTISSHSLQRHRTRSLPIQYPSNSVTRLEPHNQPQQQQQQRPRLPPRSISSRQPETLQPLRTISLPQPTSKPVPTPNIQGSRPIQPTASPSSSNSQISCPACSLVFATHAHLMHHLSKHSGIGEYLCSCNLEFEHLHRFIGHQRRHRNEVRCMLCCAHFRTPEHLARHLDQHMVANLSQSCNFCRMVFVDSDSRVRHLVKKHPDVLLHFITLNPSTISN